MTKRNLQDKTTWILKKCEKCAWQVNKDFANSSTHKAKNKTYQPPRIVATT